MSPVPQVHPLCSSDISGSRSAWMCFQALWSKAIYFSSNHHLTSGKDLTAEEKRGIWDFLGETSKHSHSHSHSHPEDANSMEMGYSGLFWKLPHSRWVSAVIIWRCAAGNWGDKLFHAVGLGDLCCPAVILPSIFGQEDIPHHYSLSWKNDQLPYLKCS